MVQDTSIESYRILKESGKLGEKQLEVYRILAEYGEQTYNEIVYNSGGIFHKSQSNVPSRLAELRRKGVVKKTGKRACAITNRVCYVHRVDGHNVKELSELEEIEIEISRLTTRLGVLKLRRQSLLDKSQLTLKME